MVNMGSSSWSKVVIRVVGGFSSRGLLANLALRRVLGFKSGGSSSLDSGCICLLLPSPFYNIRERESTRFGFSSTFFALSGN